MTAWIIRSFASELPCRKPAVPLVETAAAYYLTVEQLGTALFADLAEEQILLDPGAPIARHNVELARGLLYWVLEMRIEVGDGYNYSSTLYNPFGGRWSRHRMPACTKKSSPTW